MQAKRKLTALLLSLCMVLGVLPMTAFAAGAPAAPGDLKREWTNSGLKVSWSQPEPIGELEIFEYEVSLFVDENLKEKETVRQATDYTFKTFGDLTGAARAKRHSLKTTQLKSTRRSLSIIREL